MLYRPFRLLIVINKGGIVRSKTIIMLSLFLSACTSTTPHENFKNFMEADVGKKADDPNTQIVRYPQFFSSSRVLANGNKEIEHYYGKCKYMFEINQESNIIIGWRFEGTEQACAIVP